MYFITVLPGRYVLIDEDSLQTCLEPILRVLYTSSDDTDFIDLHLSKDEVSIIVSEKYKSYFSSGRHTDSYIAIRVDAGNPGVEEAGILADITAIFKRYSIPILSISTYRYNYILFPASLEADFTKLLVENKDLQI